MLKKDGWYLSYIWAKDPTNQLKKQMTSNSTLKLPADILTDAVKDHNLTNKIALGFNASGIVYKDKYYKSLAKHYPKYNGKEPSSLLIYNGKVIFNDYDTYPSNSVIYYIDSSNQLKYIPNLSSKSAVERKQIFQNVIDDGVKNTFSFKPVLIENGIATTTYDSGASYEYNATRQGLCQLDSNNFILVTLNTAKTKNTVVFANYLKSLGCKTAFNLDGGGSTSLLFKNSNQSNFTHLKGTRKNGTMMFFTEL